MIAVLLTVVIFLPLTAFIVIAVLMEDADDN